MLNREPSRRLQEISRLLSRQTGHEKEGVVLSCNLISCSLLFLLILPPVSCLVLVIVGICMLFLCPSSWLPIWLLLLGLLLPLVGGLLSYSSDPFRPQYLSCLLRAALCVSLALCLWCLVWIYWVADDTNIECLPHFAISIRFFLVAVLLVMALLYWLHQASTAPHVRELPTQI